MATAEVQCPTCQNMLHVGAGELAGMKKSDIKKYCVYCRSGKNRKKRTITATAANGPPAEPEPPTTTKTEPSGVKEEKSPPTVQPQMQPQPAENQEPVKVVLQKPKKQKTEGKQKIEKAAKKTSVTMPLTSNTMPALKADHASRPLWMSHDHHIFLENFFPQFSNTQQFLIAIAEPVSRTHLVQEYVLTKDSLFAAVSLGFSSDAIIQQLDKYSKVHLPEETLNFVRDSTATFGKLRMVLENQRYYVESKELSLILMLYQDKEIQVALPQECTVGRITLQNEQGENEAVYRFPVDSSKIEIVKSKCQALRYPLSMFYDFHKDTQNPNINIALQTSTRLRRYQEISLSKMFTNGRSRWGIIVLPCGAGKTLVGVTATCTIQKRTLVLCLNNVSVEQWIHQYKLWSTIHPKRITKFTSDSDRKHEPPGDVVVTTFNMLNYVGHRSDATQQAYDELVAIEWGLVLLDEVHVVPAETFRKVIGRVKTHCILGLTATLLREDDKIEDLNFLIGPKLYEANWLELSKAGSLATVTCLEVHCPMSEAFYKELLEVPKSRKTALYIMNPIKFATAHALIEFHEKRGDKIIVFADSVLALTEYAKRLQKPFIHGEVMQSERMNVLEHFKKNKAVNTIFISKVGDTSIDLPEATVIIQISSHFGSRRQEAQRLGRILRPKPKGPHATSNHAYFYSLVSTDTEELFYCAKRQQFLLDQGYSFKIVGSEEIINTCCLHLGKAMDSDPPGFGLKPVEEEQWLSRVLEWKQGSLEKEQGTRDKAESTLTEEEKRKAEIKARRMANAKNKSNGIIKATLTF